MIHGTYLIGSSLIAILIDRLVLEKRLGKIPLSVTGGTPSRTIADAIVVFCMLTLAAIVAWIVTISLLHPLGAAYLYPLFLVAIVFFIALGGEILFSRWRPVAALNRTFTRAATVCSILGLMVLAPAVDDLLKENDSSWQGFAGGAAAGAVFCCLELLWNGIEAKTGLLTIKNIVLLLSRMLIVAGLLALIFSGIPGAPGF